MDLPNGGPPQPPQMPQVPLIEIKIVFNPMTNETQISGPIQNKLLMYGILGLVHEAIANHDPRKAREQGPQIVIPCAGPLRL